MNFVEAWPEIQMFLLEAANAESGSRDTSLPEGVGEAAVETVEKKLLRAVPEELRFYLRKGPWIGEWISYGWNCELYSHEEIDFEKSKMWGDFPEADGIIAPPLVIGQDGASAFVTDLEDAKCPAYNVDEVDDWVPQLMAHSLADFLYLLSYQEMLLQVSYAKSEAQGWKEDDAERARRRKDYEAMKGKIEALAPSCIAEWNLRQYAVKDV